MNQIKSIEIGLKNCRVVSFVTDGDDLFNKINFSNSKFFNKNLNYNAVLDLPIIFSINFHISNMIKKKKSSIWPTTFYKHNKYKKKYLKMLNFQK